MKTIKHNGRILKISAANERALRIIAAEGVVKISDLAEGSGRVATYACDFAVLNQLGVEITYVEHILKYQFAVPKFVKEFVEANPRVQRLAYDTRGRARNIVAKL